MQILRMGILNILANIFFVEQVKTNVPCLLIENTIVSQTFYQNPEDQIQVLSYDRANINIYTHRYKIVIIIVTMHTEKHKQ